MLSTAHEGWQMHGYTSVGTMWTGHDHPA